MSSCPEVSPDAGASAPRPRLARSGQFRGFTLLEILIAIALLGLIAGVFVMGSAQLLKEETGSAEEEFGKALETARKYAVENYCRVVLSFDADEGAILVRALPAGATAFQFVQSFPVTEEKTTVEFLVAQKGGSSMLLGGVLVETATVQSVSVYGDGTCSPFRVQFRFPDRTDTLDIDPWTCAPILKAAAPGA